MIHGKYDYVVPLESVKSTGEYFKNFLVWEDNAHMIPLENIQGYADVLTKFIEEK
jgi:pimeloyl-ACP methyl ester carboxylesterase